MQALDSSFFVADDPRRPSTPVGVEFLRLPRCSTRYAPTRSVAGFVALADVAPSIRQDMRYAGTNYFTGRPVPGYEPGAGATRRLPAYCDAAKALARVQASRQDEGLGLIVVDCCRPPRATAAFIRWAADFGDTLKRKGFFLEVAKETLFKRGFISTHSAHSTGLAVDKGLVPHDTGAAVDLGTPLDRVGRRSASASIDVSASA